MRFAAVRAPTALDRRPAGEEMGCKRQKLRRRTTKRRGKHHQKLPNSVHSHSSDASGVFSQKATPVGETRPCWSPATDESSRFSWEDPLQIFRRGEGAAHVCTL